MDRAYLGAREFGANGRKVGNVGRRIIGTSVIAVPVEHKSVVEARNNDSVA